jgi:hypothetical protein
VVEPVGDTGTSWTYAPFSTELESAMLKMEKRRRRKEISVAARQYNVKYQHQAGCYAE